MKELTSYLITPERGKEIRLAAARHAGMMIAIANGEWDPQRFNPDSARNDAEEELLKEEVEKIAVEIMSRGLVGTSHPCSECARMFLVKKNGKIHHHDAMYPVGPGEDPGCPGVNKYPRIFFGQ